MNASDTISVLGGGHSARHYDRDRIPGMIIGVNEAGVLSKCDIAVSMDRLWTESRFPKLYERAFNKEVHEAHLRRSAVQNIPDVERLHDWAKVFQCDNASTEFTDMDGWLNGTNSGMCAFNLAYKYRPKRIILFGFDMNRDKEGRAYWHDDYPWVKPGGNTKPGKYVEWARQFDDAQRSCHKAGIEVLNASLSSAIKHFPLVDPKGLLI